jgi:hypothetical protein
MTSDQLLPCIQQKQSYYNDNVLTYDEFMSIICSKRRLRLWRQRI